MGLAEKVVPGPGNRDALVGCVKAQIYTYSTRLLYCSGAQVGPTQTLYTMSSFNMSETLLYSMHTYVGRLLYVHTVYKYACGASEYTVY